MIAARPLIPWHIGHRARGGCDDCDAHELLYEADLGIYMLTVIHNTACPSRPRKD